MSQQDCLKSIYAFSTERTFLGFRAFFVRFYTHSSTFTLVKFHMLRTTRNMISATGSILVIMPQAGERLSQIHPYKSDYSALRSDWEKVGQDMKKALVKGYEQQKEACQN